MKRLVIFLFLFLLSIVDTVDSFTLTWVPGPGSEVNIIGNSIEMGISDSGFDRTQAPSLYGASALLPVSGGGWEISIEYFLATWDSYYEYNPMTGEGGYFDSFVVSTTKGKYPNLFLQDPINNNSEIDAEFVWGGDNIYGNLEKISGQKTISLKSFGDLTYLNVYLDTSRLPDIDDAYPSWGKISIINITPIDNVIPEPNTLLLFVFGTGFLYLLVNSSLKPNV